MENTSIYSDPECLVGSSLDSAPWREPELDHEALSKDVMVTSLFAAYATVT